MYSRVYVEITNICNMSCSFCHGHAREPHRMSEQEFSCVLTALEGQTKYIYFHLMGEPLTHPALPDFVRLAVSRGFKPMITTNGTLLSTRGAALLNSGLHKINVSLHSFEGESDEQHLRYLSEVADFADAAADAGIKEKYQKPEDFLPVFKAYLDCLTSSGVTFLVPKIVSITFIVIISTFFKPFFFNSAIAAESSSDTRRFS